MTQLLKGKVFNGASIRLKQLGKSTYLVEVYRLKTLAATYKCNSEQHAISKYDHAVLYLERQLQQVTDATVNYIRDSILNG